MDISELRKYQLRLTDTSARPIPGRILPCLMCGMPFLMPMFMGEPDQICKECFKTYRECARIVCQRCQVTICRVRPALMDNGFLIRPMSLLHVDCCNICKPGLKVSTIIEIKRWEKYVRPGRVIITG